MKTRIFLCFVLILFICTPIFADDISTTELMMLISGTWINKEYRDAGWWGKLVVNENGRIDSYIEKSDTKPHEWGELVIYDIWTDDEGNIWFKSSGYSGGYFEGADQANFELNKISNSGSIWENDKSYHEYPIELNPDALLYRIWYRQ